MATTLISLEEYLRSTYKPDAEYVDGVLELRGRGEDLGEEIPPEKQLLGENRHSEWQATLSHFFEMHRREWHIRVRPEHRTRTGERRYRVPDVAITDSALPDEPIATAPPLIAIEILSPEDRLSRLVVRLADFEAMGVAAIYLIDPIDNSLLRFQDGRLKNDATVALRNLVIPFQDILAELV